MRSVKPDDLRKSLELTWRKEGINSYELSSDLHLTFMCVLGHKYLTLKTWTEAVKSRLPISPAPSTQSVYNNRVRGAVASTARAL